MNIEGLRRLPMLRRLDYLPLWQAVVIGGGLGLLLGAGFLVGTSLAVAIVGFIVLLAIAFWITASGEAIAVVERKNQEEIEEFDGVAVEDNVVSILPEPPTYQLSDLVFIEEGHFEREGYKISISAFQCMRYQLTRKLYKEIMDNNPSFSEGSADYRPVNNVSWFDAIKFCNVWSEKEGLTPCYRFGEEKAVIWDQTADGFRLLTEAEWEYACRAGTTTKWSHGDDEEELKDYAWYDEGFNAQSHRVGQKKPNPWDLYDMHGNVWEWCWDWYDDYPDQLQADPIGPLKGSDRVLRGGAFSVSAKDLSSANRSWSEPDSKGRNGGFRCARGLRHQS